VELVSTRLPVGPALDDASTMPEKRRIVVGVTGAGGTRLAGVLLNKLVDDERVDHVDVMVSANGRKLVAFENGADENADAVQLLMGRESDKISVYDPDVDQAGPPSSGSYRFTDMIILPCALGAAARIAHGIANTLLERGADVCLKERRRLVLCIRETPLNLIHLRNLVQLTEAGAVVYPMIPTYYNVPQNLKQMDEEFVLRLLGFIGLDQTDYYEWKDTSGTPALHDHLDQTPTVS
jgi:flavin prenyltransferase